MNEDGNKHSILTAAIVFCTIFFLGVAFGMRYGERTADAPVVYRGDEASLPTDFVTIGVVTFNNPGQKPGVPYLIYEEPGSPGLSVELELDSLSFCMFPNGATPCVAMSVTLDMPLSGKRVAVEGVKKDGTVVLVRKIRVLNEGEEPLLPGPGSTFIAWPHAMSFIRACAVRSLTQTHALDIYLLLNDGQYLRTVEPTIDEVFRVVQEVQEVCSTMSVATE